MKSAIFLTLPLMITACVSLSEYEAQALRDRAGLDARAQPKVVHQAYLQCYALPQSKKRDCSRKIRRELIQGERVSSWEYIIPFNHEAERLGFAAFITDQGKTCKGVTEGPQYDEKANVYNVQCTGGQSYAMRFDGKIMQWALVE